MYNANSEEQKILEFWDKDKTFEKSVNERSVKKPYVFYDGPPFATGLPHYGHIVPSTIKDAVPRFWTMRGFRVERRWGWDCHGLPIENIVEKELGTKSKKEIEAMGVAKFNELCRSKVLGYVGEWEKTIRRLGRWVDMKNAYKTMDIGYMESVWWVFKQLWDKDLVYEDYRSMHICPRCETTLSQQEVSEGYKDVKDISVVVKFKITNSQFSIKSKLKIFETEEVHILAWTTTPWTLPGNVALAVGEEIEYVLVSGVILNVSEGSLSNSSEKYIIASDRVAEVFKDKKYTVEKKLKGSDLVGLEYEPLFQYYKNTPNAFRVVVADFVTTTDGTGVVHIAPAYGEDDFKVGKRENIPLVQHVGMDGKFKPEVTDFAGQEVKLKSDDDKVRLAADINIIRYLQERGLFFSKLNINHSYPHCWRCDTPLLNYATSSWFVKVTAVKDKALKLASKINWSPEHIKEGRFGKWLEGARDWSISRQRFWASVMPVWQCEKCKKYEVFGKVADLEKSCGQKVADLHKHIMDNIVFPCAKCGGNMRRIPDVLDTWFDSGSMPYAQAHYPFEDKKKFEAGFPAEFIAEGQDQTRAWFYYLHILATAIFKKTAFKNVIVNGIVLAEDGKKMSKKLQNYPDPNLMVEKYGADALRLYLMSSPVVAAEALNFSEAGVRETYGKVVNTLVNVLEFYQLFAPVISTEVPKGRSGEIASRRSRDSSTEFTLSEANVLGMTNRNVLDRWVISKLNTLVGEITKNMEAYQLAEAVRPIGEFITELSQWYVRRSRDRFKSSSAEASDDKVQAIATLREVLTTLAKLMAPFTPFIAEKVFQTVTGKITSVHLEEWPKAGKADKKIIVEMEQARKVVELGLALRAEAGVKVRQVLGAAAVATKLSKEIQQIIADELNVKKIVVEKTNDKWLVKTDGPLSVSLDIEITDDLKQEGLAREIIRTINQMRKDAGLTPGDRVAVVFSTNSVALKAAIEGEKDSIKKAILADKIELAQDSDGQEVLFDGEAVKIKLKKQA